MFDRGERDKEEGALNGALCALSTPILLVTDSPAKILLSKAGGGAGPSSRCPPVPTWQISSCSKAPWTPGVWSRSVWPPSGVPVWCPSPRSSGRGWQLHVKSMLQLNECSCTGSGHPFQGCGWSVNAPHSVFNDGWGPNSASLESLLSSVWNL